MRPVIAVLMMGFCANFAQAKLELRDIKAVHGQLGPERKSNEYIHGDEVYIRFTIAGMKTDADGRTRAELRFTVTNKAGKVLIDRKNPLQQVLALGGDTIPGIASLELNDDFPPGEYELAVEVTDRLAKETASLKRKVVCKPVEFGLIQVGFYHDRAREIPSPVGGFVSQTLHVGLKLVGFDRSKDEIDVEMELTILDAKGKEVMPKPFRTGKHSEKPVEVKMTDQLAFNAAITLNQPGDFLLRVTITDKMTKKKLVFEAPLKVVPL